MADKSASISLHVKLFIDPSKTDEFLQALKPTYDAVTAEPANTFFELYQDANIPGVFKIVENWDLSLDDLINVSRWAPCLLALMGIPVTTGPWRRVGSY